MRKKRLKLFEEFNIIEAKHSDMRVELLFLWRFTNTAGKDVEYCNEYKERVNFSSLCFFPGVATDQ
jgi:hypothetical protein